MWECTAGRDIHQSDQQVGNKIYQDDLNLINYKKELAIQTQELKEKLKEKYNIRDGK